MGLQVKGCCCMTLRTAGLVLGWLGLVGSILHAITTTITLTRYYSHGESPVTVMHGTDSTKLFDPAVAYSRIVFCLFDAVVNGIMLYGISKNKHLMMLPWLTIKAIGMVLGALGAIFLLGYSFVLGQPVITLIAFLVILLMGLCCWFWVVIYSLYKEIRESTRQVLSIDRNTAVGTAPPYQEYENKSYGAAYP